MKLRVVAVGKLRDRWLVDGCDEYSKRIKARLPLELVELRDDDEVAPHIDKARAGGGEVWCLDERGPQLTSAQLAAALAERMQLGTAWSFVVGGADGMPEATLQRAQRRWSLGKLTLPHRLARLILLEQLYRALSIVRGEPYHRP